MPIGKAKAKPKGKAALIKWKAAKAAAKAAKLAAAAGAPTALAPGEAGAAGAEGECSVLAVVPAKAKFKGSALRAKLLEEIGDQPLDEALGEWKDVMATADAQIAEAKALVDAQGKQEEEAKKEFDEAKAAVAAFIEQEAVAAKSFRESKDKKNEAHGKVDEKRKDLLEAQKRLAMLEVMHIQAGKMKLLEERRKAANEAAEAAKRNLVEQRQKEKEALEATRKALEAARNMAKGGGKAKRVAGGVEPSPKKPATESDTVPGTLKDGADID